MQEKKPEPVKTRHEIQQPEPDSYYGIQIMGLGRKLNGGDPALKGLQVEAIKADDSSIYKYVYGNFNSKEEASAQLPQVRKKFSGAFLVKVTGTKVEYVK